MERPPPRKMKTRCHVVCFQKRKSGLWTPWRHGSFFHAQQEHLDWSSEGGNRYSENTIFWALWNSKYLVRVNREVAAQSPYLGDRVDLWILGQPEVQSRLPDIQGYTHKLCLKKQKPRNKQNLVRYPHFISKGKDWASRMCSRQQSLTSKDKTD